MITAEDDFRVRVTDKLVASQMYNAGILQASPVLGRINRRQPSSGSTSGAEVILPLHYHGRTRRVLGPHLYPNKLEIGEHDGLEKGPKSRLENNACEKGKAVE